MKLINWRFPVLLAVAFIFAQAIGAQEKSADQGLPKFYKVNANLYRGAQPSENGVRRLAEMGVKTIIDLRGDDEKAKTEAIWAQSAGVKFIDVSLNNWFKPQTSDIEQIIKYIEAPENQPVFVHCKRGADRTGTVIAVYRIAHDDWTARQAIDEAKKFDFGWWQFWMKDYINDYYNEKRKAENGK